MKFEVLLYGIVMNYCKHHKSHIFVVLIVNYDYYPRIDISSEGIVVVLCVCVCVWVSVCVCPAFLSWLLLLSLYIFERLQTLPAAKSYLLSIDVFFLLGSGKSLWFAKKYVFKCHTHIVQALGNLNAWNDRASQDF